MKGVLISLVLFVCLATSNAQQVVEKDREVVFKSVNVIPMDREQVLQNQVVVMKNGKIQSVSDPKKAKYRKNALVIDAAGRYLMPGLAEMHAHVPPIGDLEPMKDV